MISGTGALNHIGTGTTTLGRQQHLPGTTRSTPAPCWSTARRTPAVVNGGTLGGTGTVGSTTVNRRHALAGNSIGVLTINGNLVLGAGSDLSRRSLADRGRPHQRHRHRHARRHGALVFGPGSYTSNNYTILSAAGGRSGTFDTLTTSGLPATLSASLGYTATTCCW